MNNNSFKPSMKASKLWNVMRHDHDINPITGKAEKIPQCIFSCPRPVTDEELNALRSKYHATELWVEPTMVYH